MVAHIAELPGPHATLEIYKLNFKSSPQAKHFIGLGKYCHFPGNESPCPLSHTCHMCKTLKRSVNCQNTNKFLPNSKTAKYIWQQKHYFKFFIPNIAGNKQRETQIGSHNI
jgi:hypothetical protein